MITSSRPVRVVQWCTGHIGQISIRHFAANPTFDLAGVYTTSAAKDGVDAGLLAGIDPLGVTATTDKDKLLALDADCVHYAPLQPDIDDLEALLRSGKNVVTPLGFTFPRPDDEQTVRLQAACQAGGTSFHSGGIHPGFAGDILALVGSRLQSRLDQVVVTEVVDFSDAPSSDMLTAFGFGRDPEEAHRTHRLALDVYSQSIGLLATGLGLTVDRYECGLTVAVSDSDLTVASGVIPAGKVAGMCRRWEAIVDGRPAIVFQSKWKMADDLTPEIIGGASRYIVEFLGEPATTLTVEAKPSGGSVDAGRTWTAMSVVNMIHDVVAAPPGIQTHLDLPPGKPRGLFH
ncbi:dihydrodipicolinate reductase [Parafrankia colletiae]|uniref:Dihydrodipicolinate reductase n=1 Tax=Parafrankia colletiae TaxID=573497 RepID=A0A1S1QLI1_9ACTN|nr:dihydrodipicolinate reductase [Parafrankia colletiae]MCK9899937.1 dihydrodipicolinate reductase [Frankia sp. Cpl3]OHV34291.1 dihydrodipicolinate reductase [Parafrankia colletiae]